MGNELTQGIHTQLPQIPLLWIGLPSVWRQCACKHLHKPLQNFSKHLQLILLRLHLVTRWYHYECFRMKLLTFFFFFFKLLKGLKIHKKPQNSSLSYNFKLSKLPVRASASLTHARNFVWCPASTLLPRFSVSLKIAYIHHTWPEVNCFNVEHMGCPRDLCTQMDFTLDTL